MFGDVTTCYIDTRKELMGIFIIRIRRHVKYILLLEIKLYGNNCREGWYHNTKPCGMLSIRNIIGIDPVSWSYKERHLSVKSKSLMNPLHLQRGLTSLIKPTTISMICPLLGSGKGGTQRNTATPCYWHTLHTYQPSANHKPSQSNYSYSRKVKLLEEDFCNSILNIYIYIPFDNLLLKKR